MLITLDFGNLTIRLHAYGAGFQWSERSERNRQPHCYPAAIAPLPYNSHTATHHKGRRHRPVTRLLSLAVTTETLQVGRFRYGGVPTQPTTLSFVGTPGPREPRPSLDSLGVREHRSARHRELLG